MSLIINQIARRCLLQNNRLFSNPRLFCTAKGLDSKEIEKLVQNNKVVVFMKGVPDAPRCGFSNAVVQIMRMHGVNYDSHDVLSNEEIRQGDF